MTQGWPLGARVGRLSERFAVVTLPMGYRRPAGAFTAETECLVLSGAVRIGEDVREAGWYEYTPAGSRHERWTVAEGCRVLVLGPLDFVPDGHAACSRSPAAFALDSGRMAWTAERVPDESPGAAFKPLRPGLRLAAYTPDWDSRGAGVPVRELYVLSGELDLGDRTLRGGDHAAHVHRRRRSGPGAVVLLRTEAA